MSTNRLEAFEMNVLGRGRGCAQPLTDGYARANVVLLTECYHEGRLDALQPGDLRRELARVGHLIDQAERDMGARP